jgi:hypothetical protein
MHLLVEKLAVLLWRLRRLIRYNSQKLLRAPWLDMSRRLSNRFTIVARPARRPRVMVWIP